MTAADTDTRAAEEAYPQWFLPGMNHNIVFAKRKAFIAGAAHARQTFLDGLDREELALVIYKSDWPQPRRAIPGHLRGEYLANVDAVLAALSEATGNTEPKPEQFSSAKAHRAVHGDLCQCAWERVKADPYGKRSTEAPTEATREEVADIIRHADHSWSMGEGVKWYDGWLPFIADALLARYTITPRTEETK